MTNLSPAAQAVMDAFNDAPTCAEVKLAAALRALAVRINGADDLRQDVLDIADELEGITYGTYRCNLEAQ